MTIGSRMTQAQKEKALDAMHPRVPASRAMPAGRLIAITIDPNQRPWEVVLHEKEQEYTIRTPPGFDGCDDSGVMIRTDFMTAGHVTADFGIVVPKYVAKAIADGRVSKGWEPGTHLYSTIAGVLKALPVQKFVEQMVTDSFNEMEGASQTKVVVPDAPWWERAAKKLGTLVRRRDAPLRPDPNPSAPAADHHVPEDPT